MRTKSQRTRSNIVFNKIIVWFSLAGILLISASSIWTYYNTNKLIQITQERRELALGKGLALAISDLIVTREYAELESDLQQIMGNEAVKSVMVTDLKGVVFTYLERKTASGLVIPNFTILSVDIPKGIAGQYILERQDDISVLWYKVDAGIPLGWIRMETFLNQSDAILTNLRLNILFSVLVLFLCLLGIVFMLLLRAKHKTQEEELRLLNENLLLHDAAHHDTLTKLPNRLALNDLLANAIASAKLNSDLLAVCFLDLDGFKGVNDHLGHQAGDNLLIAAAGRMKKAIRLNDSVLRMGGDEFVLILCGFKNKKQLGILLNRILEMLSTPFMIEGKRVSISASCGVTIFPDDNSTPQELLTHADAAMYVAKAKGKNSWVIHTAGDKDAKTTMPSFD